MTMAMLAAIRSRLWMLVHGEHGMALPTALFAMIASMGLASAAILSSVDAQQGTARDRDAKSAIAAADAGAGVALLRLNRFQGSLSEARPCIGPGGEEQTPSSGWCPATATESVGDASFQYMVSVFQKGGDLTVIAVGTSGDVSRRIEVGLLSRGGENVFADERVIGEDNITLEGTPDIRTNIGTNGDIESDGSGTICGDIRHGVGKTAPDPDCDGEVAEGNRSLPEVTAPEGIATSNSNCRLGATCENPTEVDTYTKHRTSTTPWDPVTRTITITSNARLTMGGQDYFVCRLYVDNGELIMAEGSNVRIFFDTPENCGISAGETRLRVGGNGNVVSTGYNPSAGNFDVPGFYLLGSAAIPTTVELGGGSGTNELTLYGPYVDIDIGGSATWIGMIAGKSVRLHGTPTVESDPGMDPPAIFFSGLWERSHFVECVGASASPPDASC